MALTAFSLINALTLDIHFPIRPAKLNKSRKRARNMEPVKGIEPSFSAWEADDVPTKRSRRSGICQSVNLTWLFLASQKCPLWVISGRSAAYHANDRFRAYSGRSTSPVRIAISECPLYSIAVIQVARIKRFSTSAFGQKQTSERHLDRREFWQFECCVFAVATCK